MTPAPGLIKDNWMLNWLRILNTFFFNIKQEIIQNSYNIWSHINYGWNYVNTLSWKFHSSKLFLSVLLGDIICRKIKLLHFIKESKS